MKRLVLCAASTVATCVSLCVITGGTAAAGAGAAPVVNGTFIPAPLPTHVRHIRGTTNEASENWSGYAQVSAASNTFTEVHDTFVVPTINTSVPLPKGSEYAADWVGIGGFASGDRTLVQTGIQVEIQTRKGKSTVAYDAWTEQIPRAEKPLTSLSISAGDTVTATVQETSPDNWLMEVDDITTGQSQEATATGYSSSGLSAEAIHERPCIKAGCAPRDLARLAQTLPVTVGRGFFSVAPVGQAPVDEPLLMPATNLTLDDISMTNNKETKTIATPSGPSTQGDGFDVADGSAPPTPPNV